MIYFKIGENLCILQEEFVVQIPLVASHSS